MRVDPRSPAPPAASAAPRRGAGGRLQPRRGAGRDRCRTGRRGGAARHPRRASRNPGRGRSGGAPAPLGAARAGPPRGPRPPQGGAPRRAARGPASSRRWPGSWRARAPGRAAIRASTRWSRISSCAPQVELAKLRRGERAGRCARPGVDAAGSIPHKGAPSGGTRRLPNRTLAGRCSSTPSPSCSPSCRPRSWPHWLVERFRAGLAAAAAASSCPSLFYGYWDWRFIPLLAALDRRQLARRRGLPEAASAACSSRSPSRGNLAGARASSNTSTSSPSSPTSSPACRAPTLDIALPLGISFFTFHHVMYLTDLKAGRAPRYDLIRYALYIAFFPQVLAGPLVRWSEIMHQFDERPYARPDAAERFARGLMLLVVGLAKKVFLGDPLAEYVNPIFAGRRRGQGRHRRRGLAGDARLHLPDLFRLLRLHRHGARHRAPVRDRAAAELRRALPGGLAAGFLAALAHDPVALPARLSLHPARRQPARARRAALGPVRHHDARRAFGTAPASPSWPGASRTGSGSAPALLWRRAGWPMPALARLGSDLPVRGPRLGAVPRPDLRGGAARSTRACSA